MKSKPTYRSITSWDEVPVIFDIPMAARLLGKSTDSIIKHCQSGKLPAFKAGKEWRFEKEAFMYYIKENGNDAMKKG